MSPLVHRARCACEPVAGRAEHWAAYAVAASEFWGTAHVLVVLVSAVMLASGSVLVAVRLLERNL